MTKSEAIQTVKDYVDTSLCVNGVINGKMKEAIKVLDQTEPDKIRLSDAFEVPVWQMVWAAEPNRQISVRMTYDDLKRIVDLTNEAAKSQKWHYVKQDGNPTEKGFYDCVSICENKAEIFRKPYDKRVWSINNVYAWKLIPKIDRDRIKLPDGVRWEDEK